MRAAGQIVSEHHEDCQFDKGQSCICSMLDMLERQMDGDRREKSRKEG